MKKSKLFQSWGTFRKGLDAQSIQLSFASHLEYSLSKDQHTSTNRDLYLSLALAARDRLIERWIKTQQKYYTDNVKRVPAEILHRQRQAGVLPVRRIPHGPRAHQ